MKKLHTEFQQEMMQFRWRHKELWLKPFKDKKLDQRFRKLYPPVNEYIKENTFDCSVCGQYTSKLEIIPLILPKGGIQYICKPCWNFEHLKEGGT